ncbi:MAG: CYTH domain-containing protein [Oscillospiraceae bacterium]|jgi:uncharacterized protein YjbK|nr:CYTH domain-containing protein [Oscillospiraceae bacterium]
MREKEYKFVLNQEEFMKIVYLLGMFYPNARMQTIVQTSHYYDTSYLMLFHKGDTLRIRESGGVCRIEIKRFVSESGELRICEKSGYEIDTVPELLHGSQFEALGDVAYKRIGELHTVRRRFQLPGGIFIDCDENTYLSTTDYEIEVEIGQVFPYGFLGELVSKYKNQKPRPKYARFVEEFLMQSVGRHEI